MPVRLAAIDDEPEIRELLADIFEPPDFEVRLFSNATSCLNESRTGFWQPEVLLIDFALPDQDGFELFQNLRQIPGWAPIPALFFSAHAGESQVVTGLELGGVDFISKPFSVAEIRVRVEQTALRFRERLRFDPLQAVLPLARPGGRPDWRFCEMPGQPELTGAFLIRLRDWEYLSRREGFEPAQWLTSTVGRVRSVWGDLCAGLAWYRDTLVFFLHNGSDLPENYEMDPGQARREMDDLKSGLEEQAPLLFDPHEREQELYHSPGISGVGTRARPLNFFRGQLILFGRPWQGDPLDLIPDCESWIAGLPTGEEWLLTPMG